MSLEIVKVAESAEAADILRDTDPLLAEQLRASRREAQDTMHFVFGAGEDAAHGALKLVIRKVIGNGGELRIAEFLDPSRTIDIIPTEVFAEAERFGRFIGHRSIFAYNGVDPRVATALITRNYESGQRDGQLSLIKSL